MQAFRVGTNLGGVAVDTATRLVALANETVSSITDWLVDKPWTEARNAHRTNTPDEMQHALQSDANWLEGDVRLAPDGSLVMAHGVGDVGSGLTLDGWLAIARRSGRGVKVELKESIGFDLLLIALARTPIPQERLILNVNVAGRARVVLTDEQLVRLRRKFPEAMINLSVSPSDEPELTHQVIAELTHAATVVGGRIMFPLQWDLLTDEVIAALKPYGKIATWAAWVWGTPRDMVDETRRLRERGVDGMIDLPTNVSIGSRLVSLGARGLGALIGRQAVVDARRAVLQLLH